MNTLNSSPENVILLASELREAATWRFERSVCAMRSWYPALGENAITEDLIAATEPAPVTTGDASHPRCERGENRLWKVLIERQPHQAASDGSKSMASSNMPASRSPYSVAILPTSGICSKSAAATWVVMREPARWGSPDTLPGTIRRWGRGRRRSGPRCWPRSKGPSKSKVSGAPWRGRTWRRSGRRCRLNSNGARRSTAPGKACWPPVSTMPLACTQIFPDWSTRSGEPGPSVLSSHMSRPRRASSSSALRTCDMGLAAISLFWPCVAAHRNSPEVLTEIPHLGLV